MSDPLRAVIANLRLVRNDLTLAASVAAGAKSAEAAANDAIDIATNAEWKLTKVIDAIAALLSAGAVPAADYRCAMCGQMKLIPTGTVCAQCLTSGAAVAVPPPEHLKLLEDWREQDRILQAIAALCDSDEHVAEPKDVLQAVRETLTRLQAAAGPSPPPHREYAANELCPKCGVVLPCLAHQIPHPRVAPLHAGVDGQDLPQSDNRAARAVPPPEEWRSWGIIELAVRNPNVSSYMEHWEGRALKAEAELERLGQRRRELETANNEIAAQNDVDAGNCPSQPAVSPPHQYLSPACSHGNHGRCRRTCPACGAACVCPCRHPDAEQQAVALLTAIREQDAAGWSDLDVVAWLRERLAAHEVPYFTRIGETFPRPVSDAFPGELRTPAVDPVELARMTDEGCPHDADGGR